MQVATYEVYRLETFTVPNAARDEFLSRIRETHALLKTQPGFIQDFLLEQPAAGDTFKLATLVERENAVALERPKSVIKVHHDRTNFSSSALLEQLGVSSDLGNYRSVR